MKTLIAWVNQYHHSFCMLLTKKSGVKNEIRPKLMRGLKNPSLAKLYILSLNPWTPILESYRFIFFNVPLFTCLAVTNQNYFLSPVYALSITDSSQLTAISSLKSMRNYCSQTLKNYTLSLMILNFGKC